MSIWKKMSILLALLFVVFTVVATATTKYSRSYVEPSKNLDSDTCGSKSEPCKTIAAALTHTKPGGTIILLEANFNSVSKRCITYDYVVIHQSVKIEAAPGLADKPCFDESGSSTIPNLPDAAIEVDGNGVVVKLKGLQILRSSGGGHVGVSFAKGSALYVENCDFSNMNHGITSAAKGRINAKNSTFKVGTGIRLEDNENSKSALIINCTFYVSSELALKLITAAR